MSAVIESKSDSQLAAPFDWRDPDFMPVIAQRLERLRRIRANPQALPAIKAFYRANPANFIDDWGITTDPREVRKGKLASVPFLLWPKQRALIDWMMERWRRGEPGTVVKARDVGASYVTMALLATLCIFERNFAAGIASATEVKLDRSGDPDTLFFKLREFLRHLPIEFNGGWCEDKNSQYLRVAFPQTGSSVTGEAGDQAGRGGRKSLFIVDESAHFTHPKLIDASLAATTDCRIDISSVCGVGNSFYERAHNPVIPRIDITWRDDPRKDDEWYAKKKAEDPVTFEQEYGCNFRAGVEGQVIPASWIEAAVGAHLKLGIEPTGFKFAALDIADLGPDTNCMAFRHGILLQHLHSWPGSSSDIFKTVVRAASLCDEYGYQEFCYDGIGMGSGARGDMNRLNEDRTSAGQRQLWAEAFISSSSVDNPEGEMVPERKNKDMFVNRKSQCWWSLRLRFQATHGAVVEKLPFVADDLISLDPQIEELNALILELSQPTYSLNSVGKLLINKQPDSARSPNRADSLMMCYGGSNSIVLTHLRAAGIDPGAP